MRQITFDEMFLTWLAAEVYQIEGRNILPVAKSKGFDSITEWRLNTALRLDLDKLSWSTRLLANPNEILPNIIVGPFQGWSKFFNNQLTTSFKEALEIPEFFEWVKTHDQVIPITKSFPKPTAIICLELPNGKLIHIEGGHRICAVAFSNKINSPISLTDEDISLVSAKIPESEIDKLKIFLQEGTGKK